RAENPAPGVGAAEMKVRVVEAVDHRVALDVLVRPGDLPVVRALDLLAADDQPQHVAGDARPQVGVASRPGRAALGPALDLVCVVAVVPDELALEREVHAAEVGDVEPRGERRLAEVRREAY